MDIKKAIATNPVVTKVATKTWKAGPTISFVVGAIGSVATVCLVWRAARKHDEVMSDAIDILDEVHEKKPTEEGEEPNENALPVNDYRKELIKAYIKAGFKIGKLYAPVVVSEAVSLGLMGFGYGTLNGRYVSTLATASLLEREYAKYRRQVVDNLGEDIDQQFRFGLKDKEFEQPELDKDGNPKVDKNGVVKAKKIKERVLDDDQLEGYSGYAVIFDKQHCKHFDGDDMATSWYNREYLIKQEQYFNMLLQYRPTHTVFLNEVYQALGYEPTKEGQVVGWHYDPDHPVGDNKIMFVPIEFYDEKYETKSAILDFNVDGVVWEFL